MAERKKKLKKENNLVSATSFGYPYGTSLSKIFDIQGNKFIVPSDFQGRCSHIEAMLEDDMSGLVDTLVSFMVTAALVDIRIETNKDTQLNNIFERWMKQLNIGVEGITPGIKSLAKEYFIERWKSSSFAAFRIVEWKDFDGYYLPNKIICLDGSSIYAEDPESDKVTVSGYDYYLGRKKETKISGDESIIYSKINARYFDKYPIPFLIKRGIYYNWLLIKALKSNQTKVLGKVLPYLMLMTKGNQELLQMGKMALTNEEYTQMTTEFQNMVRNLNSLDGSNVAGAYATSYDTKIDYKIPDLTPLFKAELFQMAERNILCGFGLIDIVDLVSSNRKESVLNPKAFISEIQNGIEDFKQIIYQIVYKIQNYEQNQRNKKYNNVDCNILSSKPVIFDSIEMKNLLRQLYERGLISKQSAVEQIANMEFDTEVYRRKTETKEDLNDTMYPPVILNQEDSPNETQDINNEEIPEDKQNPIEKQKYNMASFDLVLEGSPYKSIDQLPENVKKLSPDKQDKWMKIFNNAYFYALGKFKSVKKAETYAFRVAWSKV